MSQQSNGQQSDDFLQGKSHDPHEHKNSESVTEDSPIADRILRTFIGPPKDLNDRSIYHSLALIPFLAWVGLGADGLSSSSYGPEEAFKTLGEHSYMAVGLALVTGLTVLIISAAYSRIIQAFPHGGGGYVVASKLLGKPVGVVSGCALLVDYVLTVTVSIAAAGDALYSFLPPEWAHTKFAVEIALILGLTILNIRGVKESVTVLAPVFILFLITHIVMIVWGIVGHLPDLPGTISHVSTGFKADLSGMGPMAMMLLFIHAYSLGGGTYTGIEAVSNGLPIMREPRVATAKRTMIYMATSLSITAAGLLFCYLLWRVTAVSGKTMNAVLLEKMAGGSTLGNTFIIVTLLSEGLLLIVAAQAGFLDGPRVLANMAVDSWMPHKFSALSDRLTTANGIILMGAASLAALIYTRGDVQHLVVMYSINVFLTFSISMFGMLRHTWRKKAGTPERKRDFTVFISGFILCITILVITTVEKFTEGGWITLAVTGSLVLICFYIKSHYLGVARKLQKLYSTIDKNPGSNVMKRTNTLYLNSESRTAVVLVGGYGGLGIQTFQTIQRTFPEVFENYIFVSIGVVDSGGFKGTDAVDSLKTETSAMLEKYKKLAEDSGFAADYRFSIGTDVVNEAENVCRHIGKEFPRSTFFTGKIIFAQDSWINRMLHNETGLALQKRLQLDGLTMVVLPAKVL